MAKTEFASCFFVCFHGGIIALTPLPSQSTTLLFFYHFYSYCSRLHSPLLAGDDLKTAYFLQRYNPPPPPYTPLFLMHGMNSWRYPLFWISSYWCRVARSRPYKNKIRIYYWKQDSNLHYCCCNNWVCPLFFLFFFCVCAAAIFEFSNPAFYFLFIFYFTNFLFCLKNSTFAAGASLSSARTVLKHCYEVLL